MDTVPPENAVRVPEVTVRKEARLSVPIRTMEGARIPLVTALAAATPKMFVEVSNSLVPSLPLTSYTASTPWPGRLRLVSVSLVKLEAPPSCRRTMPPAFMLSVVAVFVRLPGVDWRMLRAPPLRVMVAAPKGVAVLEANTPPPPIVRLVMVETPAAAVRVPRPVFTKVPLLTPEVVKTAPAATSTAPLVRDRLRVVAKELVIHRAAGAVAEGPLSVTVPLAAVSPSAASAPTPATPALMVRAATGLIPLNTIVPMPFLVSVPAPLMTLEAACVSVSPAPMSKIPAPLRR